MTDEYNIEDIKTKDLIVDAKTANTFLFPAKIHYPNKSKIITIKEVCESISAITNVKTIDNHIISPSSIEIKMITFFHSLTGFNWLSELQTEIGYLVFKDKSFDNVCGFFSNMEYGIYDNLHQYSFVFCGILGDFTKEINGSVIDKEQKEIIKHVRLLNRKFTF